MAHAVTRPGRSPRSGALLGVGGAALAGVLLLGGCSAAGGGPSPSSLAASGQTSDPTTGSTVPDGSSGTTTSSAARSGSRTASPGSSIATSHSSAAGGTATSPGTTHSTAPGRSSSRSTSSGAKPPAHSSSSAPATPNLSAQLLTLSDLPSGWAAASSGSFGSDGGVQLPACFTAADRSAQAAADATAAFAQNQQLPVLTENLGYYPGSSATSNYSAAVSALDSCVGTTVSISADGYSLKGKVLSLSLSALGDASRAYGVSLSGYGVTIWLGISVVRTGHELVAVVYAAQGRADSSSLQHYAGLAVTKAS